MPLAAGTQLGSYEIVGLLGAGGMGEVYRAKDSRLGRDVALKTLPDSVTQDPERLARFRREAQVLAALNHQHIAGIYGLEEADRYRFLVLEFVDGETLAARIQKGALPLDEALSIAREIAEALQTAHERGIVHRDLKPANVALTSSDRVKVLDFGLAKAADSSADAIESLNAPTITSPALLTQVGMVLGTAAYMSPEQAKGREADKRSDIWAFGCVLFEMLTGRRAFGGDDVTDTLASVLRSDPAWDALPPSLAEPIRSLLKGCLEKNVRERISDMSTVLFVLKHEPLRPLAAPAPRVASGAVSAWRRALPVSFLLAGAALGALAAMALWPRPSTPPKPVARFELPMTDRSTLTLSRRAVAVSRDGSHIAYTADGRIFIRSIAEATAKPLAGADPGILPAFSPDGRSLMFWANRELKRISIAGGVPVRVAPTTPAPPFVVEWEEGGILFDQRPIGIVRVSPDGGTPQPIVRVTDDDGLVQSLQLLPDRDTVLFSISRLDGRGDVFVQSIRTGQRKTILEGGSDARYLPTGHLVYLVRGTLMMRPFDVQRNEPTGSAVPIIAGVLRSGGGNFATSDTGVLIYIPGPAQTSDEGIIVYDRKGVVTQLKLPRGTYQNPRVSPDGKWLAFETLDDKETAIGVYELWSANQMRRLGGGGNNRAPVWSADSKRVAFQSDRGGQRAIFWQPVDGGPAEPLTQPEPGTSHTPEAWAPRSDVLVYSANKGGETTLWTFSANTRSVTRFGDVISLGWPTNAAFSPDGKWIAYQVQAHTSSEALTYVEPFPRTGTRHQIANGGRPVWSHNGKELELLFVPGPGQFRAITIHTQPTFGFTNPVRVPRYFAVAFPGNPRPYDVLPDGRLVTVGSVGESGEQEPARIQVVLNWFEELTRTSR